MTYLKYSPEIENLEAEEQESIDGIIHGMTQQTQTVEKREHHAVRASHAKSTGVVVGELRVAPDLPPQLAQGLFAQAARYPVAVREDCRTRRNDAGFCLCNGHHIPLGHCQGFFTGCQTNRRSHALPEGFKSALFRHPRRRCYRRAKSRRLYVLLHGTEHLEIITERF